MTKLIKMDILTPGKMSLDFSLPSTEGQKQNKDAVNFINLSDSISGNLLVAMPNMSDKRFRRSVIFLCAHGSDGAMGLVINRLAGRVNYGALLTELGVATKSRRSNDRPVFLGGPVEPTRGFILHSSDHIEEGTMVIDTPSFSIKKGGTGSKATRSTKAKFAVTATTDMLSAIQQGKGPARNILVLGYAGWGPGQLESEIQANGWLTVKADEDIVFGGDVASKWHRALGKLGIDPARLSSEAGRA